jgi:archaellum component FlaC
MAMTEEVARLILEAQTTTFVSAMSQVQTELASTKGDVYELMDAYELMEDEFDQMVTSVIASANAVKQQEQALGSLETQVRRAAAAGSQASRSTRDVGMAALEASRGIEDFQYGIHGVINNVPSLVMALGGTAGLTAAISLVAVGVAQLVKHWPEFMGLFSDRVAVPEATNALGRYEEALKKVNGSLEELKKQTSLSYDELERFKKLTEEQRQLEEKVAQERLTEANRKAHGEHTNQADRERAQGFGKALDEAGGFQTIVDRFVQATMIQTKSAESERAGFKAAWEEVFNKALQGNAKAIETIKTSAELDKTGMTGIFDKDIVRYSPDTKHAAEEKKRKRVAQDEADEFDAEARKVFKAAQDKASKALGAALTKQGAENEKIALKQLDDMKKEKVQQQHQIDKGAAAFSKDVAGQAKAMGGFQAQGEAALARGIAGGQFEMGANGQLSAAGFQRLNEMVSAELKRQMPNLKPGPAAALGQQLSANIEKGVGDKFLQQAGAGLNAHQATQEVLLETQQALLRFGNKLQIVEAQNRQLAQNARALKQMAAQPSPTNLPAGSP